MVAVGGGGGKNGRPQGRGGRSGGGSVPAISDGGKILQGCEKHATGGSHWWETGEHPFETGRTFKRTGLKHMRTE